MKNFDEFASDQQVRWRKKLGKKINQNDGWQNGLQRSWILPAIEWEEGLWEGIRRSSRNSLPDYLHPTGKLKPDVQRHTGAHNLKSSWILCANLYFAFRNESDLLVKFLCEKVDQRIEKIKGLDLEYEDDKLELKPSSLLKEPADGGRGSGQTSPDLGIRVVLRDGSDGLILVENKYVEHSFYPCSGRKKGNKNPDNERCKNIALILSNPNKHCWLCGWAAVKGSNRTYWDHLLAIFNRKAAGMLTRCPATSAGYQIFRQQALAEGIAKDGKYALVASCVAYDDRNNVLKECLKTTGINSFKDWGKLFDGKAIFKTWTHQEWVEFVRKRKYADWHNDWLIYVEERYEF